MAEKGGKEEAITFAQHELRNTTKGQSGSLGNKEKVRQSVGPFPASTKIAKTS